MLDIDFRQNIVFGFVFFALQAGCVQECPRASPKPEKVDEGEPEGFVINGSAVCYSRGTRRRLPLGRFVQALALVGPITIEWVISDRSRLLAVARQNDVLATPSYPIFTQRFKCFSQFEIDFAEFQSVLMIFVCLCAKQCLHFGL